MTVATTLLPQRGGRPHADHRSPSLSLEASGKPEPLEDELFVGSSILQSQNSTTEHLEVDRISLTLTSVRIIFIFPRGSFVRHSNFYQRKKKFSSP